MDKLSEYKKLNAPSSTITRNVMDLSTQTGNIYETAVLIAQRADQIAHELKQELSEKLPSTPIRRSGRYSRTMSR